MARARRIGPRCGCCPMTPPRPYGRRWFPDWPGTWAGRTLPSSAARPVLVGRRRCGRGCRGRRTGVCCGKSTSRTGSRRLGTARGHAALEGGLSAGHRRGRGAADRRSPGCGSTSAISGWVAAESGRRTWGLASGSPPPRAWGSSMEAALRYMLAEYLCETGRLDDAAVELAINLERRHVTGMPAMFSRGATWRASRPGAATPRLPGTAWARTRELTALAPQQPLPLAAALSGEAERLFWAGRLDESAALAREAVDLGSVTAFDAAEPLAVLCGVEADLAEQVLREDLRAGPGDALLTRLDGLRGEVAPRAGAFLATCEAELSALAGRTGSVPWRTALDAGEWGRRPVPGCRRPSPAGVGLAGPPVGPRGSCRVPRRCAGRRRPAGAHGRWASRGRSGWPARRVCDRTSVSQRPWPRLTSREREVLRLVVAGRTERRDRRAPGDQSPDGRDPTCPGCWPSSVPPGAPRPPTWPAGSACSSRVVSDDDQPGTCRGRPAARE